MRVPKIKGQPPQVAGYQSAYVTKPITPSPVPLPPPPAAEMTTAPLASAAVPTRPIPAPGSMGPVGPSLNQPARMPNTMNPLTQGAQPPMASSAPMQQGIYR